MVLARQLLSKLNGERANVLLILLHDDFESSDELLRVDLLHDFEVNLKDVLECGLQELNRHIVLEHLCEGETGSDLDWQLRLEHALVDSIHGLLDMLVVVEFIVAVLAVDPTGTTPQQWMCRGKVRQHVSLEHCFDVASEVRVESHDLIQAANREEKGLLDPPVWVAALGEGSRVLDHVFRRKIEERHQVVWLILAALLRLVLANELHQFHSRDLGHVDGLHDVFLFPDVLNWVALEQLLVP